MARTPKQVLGDAAEQRACDYLTAHGLTILARQYRIRQGEIDIIARDDESVVMIEVRYRSRSDYGSAVESIDQRKQRRIIHAAQHYLLTTGCDLAVRFDVIAINAQGHLEWISDAFRADD